MAFTVDEICDHEKTCKKKGAYQKKRKSLYQARVDKPLGKEAFKVIDLVIQWSSENNVSPCDFLFFALTRLIDFEAPEMEESVKEVFQIFLKKASSYKSLTPLQGLALQIKCDLSQKQYTSLSRSKVLGPKLPSIQSVIKAKDVLDPGNVSYTVYNKASHEVIAVHTSEPKSGLINVEEDIGNISYGDLNIMNIVQHFMIQ